MKKSEAFQAGGLALPPLYFRDYSMHYNYELAVYNFK